MVSAMTEFASEQAFARELVLECGRKLREKQQTGAVSVRYKTSHADLVTDHDIWVQEYLARRLRTQFPQIGLLGEEGAGPSGCSDLTWVIDPIDGTTNYCQYRAGYSISLALCRHEQPVAGWVLDVQQDKLYELSGKPVPVPEETAAEGILYLGHKTALSFQEMGGDPWGLARLFRGVRYFGCASLELCLLTRSPGLYLNTHLQIWDFAAAQAILESHGYHLVAFPGANGSYMVCAWRSHQLLEQCLPFFPACIRQKIRGTGGIPPYASN